MAIQRVWLAFAALVGSIGLSGCAGGSLSSVLAEPARKPAADATWTHQSFPGKRATEFSFVSKDGRQAVEAWADTSASVLRKKLDIAPEAIGRLGFSWNVPALIEHADMARRESDDAPVRIVLAFDGDRSRFSPRDAMLSELSQVLTGEPLPYATLMYVWCNQRKQGEVIINPRTDRIRKIVVESGADHLGRWIEYDRDVRADFERVFGEPPGRLVGVALMTDTDNTQSKARAWYGPVSWSPAVMAGR